MYICNSFVNQLHICSTCNEQIISMLDIKLIIATINSWVTFSNRVSVNRNGDKAFQTGTVLRKKRKLMCINVRQKTLKPEWVLHTYSYNTERGCCLSWSWKILSNRVSFTQSLISWYYWYHSVCMETRQWSHTHTVDGHCQVGLFLDNRATSFQIPSVYT